MALKNMSLMSAATGITVVGGTALPFADNGVTIPNGLQCVIPGDVDYQTRRSVTVKFRPPALDSKTNSYGKDKKSICLVQPIVLANGTVIFNTMRIEREVHPSLTAAQCTELNRLGAQLLTDTDTDAFWATGSLS